MTCTNAQSQFSPYLDGALSGAEMRRIAEHLEACPHCSRHYKSLRRTQSLVAALGRKPAPPELALKIRVSLAQQRRVPLQRRFEGYLVRLEHAFNTFMLPATAGLVTSVIVFGLFVGLFVVPRSSATIGNDVPTSLYMPPRLSSSPFTQALDTEAPVVIEAFVSPRGRLEDYRIIAGEDNARIRKQLDRSLLFAIFEPAMSFGQPASGSVVISFSGINVKG
jgi:anti-sigma factor RsiW